MQFQVLAFWIILGNIWVKVKKPRACPLVKSSRAYKKPPGEPAVIAEKARCLIRRMRYPLFLSRSADGAGFSANAAFDALVRVDFVLAIAFSDRFLGAFGGTGAAADARIGNFVSHNDTSKYRSCILSRPVYHTIPAQKRQAFRKIFIN
jgi:hypothetical protein